MLFLSKHPVAIDPVMRDHIAAEIATQGAAATSSVRACVTHIHFPGYAMTHHGLGAFERKPCNRIHDTVVEA